MARSTGPDSGGEWPCPFIAMTATFSEGTVPKVKIAPSLAGGAEGEQQGSRMQSVAVCPPGPTFAFRVINQERDTRSAKERPAELACKIRALRRFPESPSRYHHVTGDNTPAPANLYKHRRFCISPGRPSFGIRESPVF